MAENQQFRFSDTTATRKVFELKKRIRAVAGGTSASKTISILVWLIDYCQSPKNKNKVCTVTSESYPHLEGGAILDFKSIMQDRGYWDDSQWNETKHVYKFGSNTLEFKSMDKYGKAHGPRRDVLFVNEANNLKYDIVDQLMVRTRETVWMDWNPTSEFWFYTEMLGNRDDIDFITLTYKDVECLDDVTIREIESHKNNKNWWRVYGLGLMGEVEGRIYGGWQIIDDIPHEARLERYGLDFGYTNDPSAIVAVYKYNNGLIFDEILYQKGLSNKDLADVILNLDRALVICDSAEPKSIHELVVYGLPALACKKGKDSVVHGIQRIQYQKVSITKRSINMLKEYRNYMWEQDKDGKFINSPIDFNNHCLDAARYAVIHMYPKKDKFHELKSKNSGQWLIDKIERDDKIMESSYL